MDVGRDIFEGVGGMWYLAFILYFEFKLRVGLRWIEYGCSSFRVLVLGVDGVCGVVDSCIGAAF